jgi:uncharacterized membrane protein YraQ (UPF0718 family)
MKPDKKKVNIRGKTKKGKYPGIYFLGAVLFLYFIISLYTPGNIAKSFTVSLDMFIHVLPSLVLIVLFMGIVNHFVHPGTLSKYVGEGSGVKGWVLAICTGILSHGPIYAWYPLLSRLRDQGMKSGLIAVFLYNRAIKIPLLPVIIYYFGITFVVVLAVYLIIGSVVQGYIVEIIETNISHNAARG